MIKDYDAATFNEDIANGPVLLKFFSKTCGPCKMLAFVLEDVNKSFDDDLLIINIDFEENQDLVSEYDVEGYPTMVMLKDGSEVARKEGLQQKPVIEKMIKEAI